MRSPTTPTRRLLRRFTRRSSFASDAVLAKGDNSFAFLLFGTGFFLDHHRKTVADRIDQPAGGAAQALPIGRHLDRSLANRANQHIQQGLVDCHAPSKPPNVAEMVAAANGGDPAGETVLVCE